MLVGIDRVRFVTFASRDQKEHLSSLDGVDTTDPSTDSHIRHVLSAEFQTYHRSLLNGLESPRQEDMREVSRALYDAVYELPSLAAGLGGLRLREDGLYHHIAMGLWRATSLFDEYRSAVDGVTEAVNQCVKSEQNAEEKPRTATTPWTLLIRHVSRLADMSVPRELDAEAAWEDAFSFWTRTRAAWEAVKARGVCPVNAAVADPAFAQSLSSDEL